MEAGRADGGPECGAAACPPAGSGPPRDVRPAGPSQPADGSGDGRVPGQSASIGQDGEAEASGVDAATAAQPSALSKNQQKKRRKQQEYEARKAARKATEKGERKQKVEARRAEARQLFASMDEAQREAWRQGRADKRQVLIP